jgi:protein translocase SecG subunit
MLYEIGITFYIILILVLILLVMVQRGHGGFWSGPGNNDSVTLFGGSGGSDVLQKVTWVCGFIFIILTLSLSLYKTYLVRQGKYSVESKQVNFDEETLQKEIFANEENHDNDSDVEVDTQVEKTEDNQEKKSE